MTTEKSFTFTFSAVPGIKEIREFIEAGENYLSRDGGAFFVDCVRISLFNSIALGAVLRLHNLYRRQGRSVILLNVSGEVITTLNTSGLIHILNVQQSKGQKIDIASAVVNIAVEIDFEIHEDIGIFKFGGSMLTPTDNELFFNMAKKIITEGHKMLIDMSELVYIDSMGIGAIIKIHQLMKEHKGEIRLCSAGDILREVLESQNLTSVVPLFENKEAALKGWV
jgi:anti-sigma B factor antagonist